MNQKPELTFNWTTPVKIPEGDPPIAHDDSTPSIIEQAKVSGWKAEYYDFGKAEREGTEYFNPAIVERSDGLWLLVRRSEPHPQGFQFGQNDVWAFMLDETGKTPKFGKRLKWMNREPSQHFEDPRGFYHARINQTLIGTCTFVWYPNQPWTGAHQCLGAFDENWICQKMDYPKIGGNPGEMKRIEKHENYEKNWLWWLANDQLHLLYKAHPWMVIQFGKTWSEPVYWKLEEGAKWAYGDIRGGTTPVQVGDYYFTFHHSSLPWKGRYRRYYAGCLAFEAKPPFKPVLITPEPILTGSQNDDWVMRKPLVIFPCGALYRNGIWLVTAGVNDLKAAWIELSHESLLSRMCSIGDHTTIFTESGLSHGEQLAHGIYAEIVPEVKNTKLEKLRANAAKARAVLAEKRLKKAQERKATPTKRKVISRAF